MHLDAAARRVTMSALLYYSLDAPILTDADFDKLCKRCIEEWDDLSPLRKWQLGSREDLATTGYHIKITQAGVSGAISWGKLSPIVFTKPARWSKKHLVSWWNCGDFAWNS